MCILRFPKAFAYSLHHVQDMSHEQERICASVPLTHHNTRLVTVNTGLKADWGLVVLHGSGAQTHSAFKWVPFCTFQAGTCLPLSAES